MTDLHEMLLKVRQGEISLAEAESYLRRKPFEDMGYAKVTPTGVSGRAFPR